MQRKIDTVLQPKSIAVIGASNSVGSIGYAAMQNMLTAGYEGVVYPINVKRHSIQGVKAYKKLQDLPEKIDLALICTPAPTVLDLVEECGEAGVRGVVILSNDFKQEGPVAKKVLYQQIRDKARQYNMRVIGPNSMGYINPHLGINASYASQKALPGKLALISQSGALLTSILDWARTQNVGFSNVVSTGSMVDIDYASLIDYFGTDYRTSCILIYLESLRDAHHFMSAARAFARNKPVIVLKAGRSKEGGKAAMSHTGVLAGNDAIYDAAFRRAGIIRVDTVAQLFNMAQALAMQPRPRSNRLAIVTNAGGPGVLATDYLSRNGARMATFSEKTIEKLDAVLPPHWSHGNPVDLPWNADENLYQKAVEACLFDEGVDGVLVVLTPHLATRSTAIAKAVVAAAKRTGKPVQAAWMGEEEVQEARNILEAGSIPNYRYPESAVDVFIRMCKYARDLELLYETPSVTPESFAPQTLLARQLIKDVYAHGRTVLAETEARNLLSCYDIQVSHNRVCKTVEEAVDFANELGYPVVLKVASPDILHKTDAGGVKLNIRNAEEVSYLFERIMSNARAYKPDAAIEGILVERMVRKGFELLLGGKKDPVFGPVVVFGRGGVAVEVFKDTRIGLPPLNMALARRIIRNTQIYPLLKGYRGMDGVNLDELAFLLIKFSYLLMDLPQISEIDINPYVIDAKGGLALDVRIGLDPEMKEVEVNDYRHLVISPYPAQYVRTVTVKDGREVLLRPIRPEDEPAIEAMLGHVSSDSLYMRFFGYVPKITHTWLTRFTHIDYDREIAIVAEIEHEGQKEIMGVVRIIEDAWRETAEYSILISDRWQGLGLGNILTNYILEIGKQRKINKIVASVLPANKPMVHMFESRGFTFDRSDMEIYEVELSL